jgi:hypothetical protein
MTKNIVRIEIVQRPFSCNGVFKWHKLLPSHFHNTLRRSFSITLDVFANLSPCRPESDSNSFGSKCHHSSYCSTCSAVYFCCFYFLLVIKTCVLKVFPSTLFAEFESYGRLSGINKHNISIIFRRSPQNWKSEPTYQPYFFLLITTTV